VSVAFRLCESHDIDIGSGGSFSSDSFLDLFELVSDKLVILVTICVIFGQDGKGS